MITEEPWNKHTPGDPMPCKCGESVVEVKSRGGFSTDVAKYWYWGKDGYDPQCEITDWRFVERKGEDVIQRCAECDCGGGSSECSWIKSEPSDPHDALSQHLHGDGDARPLMTADLDLSPEAVERLAKVCCETGSNYMTATQAPAVMLALAAENERLRTALAEMTRRRDAWREKAAGHDELRAAVRAGIEQAGDRNLSRVFLRGALAESEQSLSEARAESARLRAERDEQRERAEEAESEITRAQEQVSAEFEGDCWKTLRNLLDRTGFDWSEYSEDGVTASDAQEWIVDELDRLRAERAAAWQAGAEAMREAAASVASNACLVPPDGGSPTEEERLVCEEAWRRIRALPLPTPRWTRRKEAWMSEWRVVVKGERRPIGPVLVFSVGITPEDRAVSAIYGGEPEASFEFVIARWQRGAWRDFKRGWIIHDVTHWMPLLPAPPASMKDE